MYSWQMPPRKQQTKERRTGKAQVVASTTDLLGAAGLDEDEVRQLAIVRTKDNKLAFDPADLNSFMEFVQLAKKIGVLEAKLYLEQASNRVQALRASPTLAEAERKVRQQQEYERGDIEGIQTDEPCRKEGCSGCLTLYKQQTRAGDEATDVFYRCGACLTKFMT